MDDITGEPLIQRADDKPETLAKRMQSYNEQTAPVLEFYKARNKLRTINADQPISTVWNEVKTIINTDTKQLQ